MVPFDRIRQTNPEGGKDSGLCRIRHKLESLPPFNLVHKSRGRSVILPKGFQGLLRSTCDRIVLIIR